VSEYDAQSVSIVDGRRITPPIRPKSLTSVGFRVEDVVSAQAFLESRHRTNNRERAWVTLL
jgi:hypothetical protein